MRDTETGEEIRRFSGGAGCIQGVAFSPDGKQIATTSNQRALRVWDFETGRELLTLPGSSAIQFTPDGTHLISVVSDTVQVYLLQLEDLITLA